MAQPPAGGLGAGVVRSSLDDRAAPPVYRRDRARRWLPACSGPVGLVRSVPDPQVAGADFRSIRDRTIDDF